MSELQGRSRWLLWPAAWASLFAALPAAAYLWAAVRVPSREPARLVILGLLVLAAIVGLFAMRGQARVRTVRRLATGRLEPSERNLIAAIREARGVPWWISASTLGVWVAACLGFAGIARVVGGAALGDQVRIASLALTAGTLAGLLAYFIAVRRSRRVIEALGTRLPAQTVVAALGTKRTRRTRQGFVSFVAIIVMLPVVMVADASRVETFEVLAKVSRAPRHEQAEVARVEARAAASKVLLLAVLLGVLALGISALQGESMAEPMRRVADEAMRISRGDLREVHVVPAEEEVWAVTATFTQLQAQLQAVIAQLQRAGISIGSTTEQLMATSSKYESGAADQATSLNETSATTEELAQSARQISHNAASVSDLAQKTLDAAREGQGSAAAFVNAVERMRNDNNSIAEAVSRLQRRVQQIGRIVEFITTVADRSDLLALSAELEGTKAGDVGRGFTLVAAEMRRLAENVIESTNEIEELIGEIREATHATVGATARGMEHTASGTELATSVSQALESVVALAQSTSDSVRAISLATQQQQTSTDQLAEAMADILGITQQSLAATKQVTSANHDLITLSADLKGLVEQFQVKRT